MHPIKNILIVGGGTAGWLTAAFLARTLAAGPQGAVRITLVESSELGIIGVGEGSFPSLRGTLAAIGIDEARFVHACSATYKQGIRFDHWLHAPGTRVDAAGVPAADHYFHPFSQPSQRPGGPDLLPYWLLGAAGPGVPFAEAVTMQKRIVDAAHGPKRLADGDYQGPLNYAYHFDAGRLAALLAEQGQALGVVRVVATVRQVQLAEDGAIAAVHTQDGQVLRADLYIDCTGFRAELIGRALGSPFRSASDVLLVDRAIAMQVPYARADAPIASATLSTAHEAGWTWDIGLQERRGIGYVYSSRHSSDERAEQVLRRHIGAAAEGLTPRQLKLEVGFRERQWIHNCVAVGLSGGFVEPLEASGIGLIEMAAYLIGYLFPANGDMAPVARQFNTLMQARYERIIDFVKMHYCLTQRRDTPFWVDNTDVQGIPASLRDKLAMWRCRPPHRLDFMSDLEMYPTSSWQYVLYGMGYATTLNAASGQYPRQAEAAQEFKMIRQVAQHALNDLPSHRALVDHQLARAAGHLSGAAAVR